MRGGEKERARNAPVAGVFAMEKRDAQRKREGNASVAGVVSMEDRDTPQRGRERVMHLYPELFEMDGET